MKAELEKLLALLRDGYHGAAKARDQDAMYRIGDAVNIAQGCLYSVSTAPPAPAAPVLGTVLINGMPYRRPVMQVAALTVDGSTCIMPLGDLPAMLEDGGEYTVQVKTMAVREFERLPEFNGF